MTERAQRIGAQIEVMSTPARGSSVILTLTPPSHPSTTNAARIDNMKANLIATTA
jgi:Flp pilus assembly protein TadB